MGEPMDQGKAAKEPPGQAITPAMSRLCVSRVTEGEGEPVMFTAVEYGPRPRLRGPSERLRSLDAHAGTMGHDKSRGRRKTCSLKRSHGRQRLHNGLILERGL